MTELVKDSAAIQSAELLDYYSFDLGGYSTDELVHHWLHDYSAGWIRSAVVEALYQGRYKAISVEQILVLWQRRGYPLQHFNHEFERMICGSFVKWGTAPPEETSQPATATSLQLPPMGSGFASPKTEDPPAPQTKYAKSPTEALEFSDRSNFGDSISSLQLHEKPIQTFKPTGRVNPTPESTGWSREEVVKQPIHQFIPTPPPSDLYGKLKAVSQGEDDVGRSSGNLAYSRMQSDFGGSAPSNAEN